MSRLDILGHALRAESSEQYGGSDKAFENTEFPADAGWQKVTRKKRSRRPLPCDSRALPGDTELEQQGKWKGAH